ncbi:hypothetical protein [Nonomuraea sp. NPDC049695]|uniref:hypothetical protein n=1 Tax=Nonomuraea sp. NPDC049695 TaxID=3154734 RepID=UPI00343DA5A8
MAADTYGFELLGVPRPPQTGGLEHHAGVLEAVAARKGALGGEGARAYRLGGANTGPASDALAAYVMGKDGVLPRTEAHAHHVSVAASITRVAVTTLTWAGGVLVALAGLAVAFAATPQGRVLLARLRSFGQRVQRWIRSAMHAAGRILTRLAELVRAQARKRAGKQPGAEPRAVPTQGALRAKVVHARMAAHQSRAGMDRAEVTIRDAAEELRHAKSAVRAKVDNWYENGMINAEERERLRENAPAGWVNHPGAQGMDGVVGKYALEEKAEMLRKVEAQLEGHVTRHLDDAARRVDEGLKSARSSGADATDLRSLQHEVAALRSRRSELLEEAKATRSAISGSRDA